MDVDWNVINIDRAILLVLLPPSGPSINAFHPSSWPPRSPPVLLVSCSSQILLNDKRWKQMYKRNEKLGLKPPAWHTRQHRKWKSPALEGNDPPNESHNGTFLSVHQERR